MIPHSGSVDSTDYSEALRPRCPLPAAWKSTGFEWMGMGSRNGPAGFVISSRAVNPTERVDLSVQVGALRLANPIIAASGTFGYGLEFAHLVDLKRLGGFVTKGISLEPIEGAPAPRLCETPSGMLNAVGLTERRSRRIRHDLNFHCCENTTLTVIVNVFGYCLEEYVSVIRRLERCGGDCSLRAEYLLPKRQEGWDAVRQRPCSCRERWSKRAKSMAEKRPLWVKLMPLVTDIGLMARRQRKQGPMP